MSKRVWTIRGSGKVRTVLRNGVAVARVKPAKDYAVSEGKWSWKGMSLGFSTYRTGFDTPEDAMADVQWYWRYQRGKPLITFKYASGRKVEVW